MRFLALGDSYTIGESVTDAERWPVVLRQQLVQEGIPLDQPEIIARTGWTSDELATAIATEAPAGPFEIVSLLIGVNNQYRGRPVEEYRVEFGELLDTAIALAGGEPGRVLVLSIPDWSVTPFAEGRERAGIAADIDRYNAANREATGRRGARYIDITGCSRGARTDAGLTASDGLHPSGAKYAEWVRLALPHARAALIGGQR